MQPRTAVFLINLLQDVNIARPLIIMAARDFNFDAILLVSSKFISRDHLGIWQTEIDVICSESGARSEIFDDDFMAHRFMTGRHGVIFASSESILPPHVTTHNILRHAPAGFIRVTLQHGFECVGFRHSADHDMAYGKTVSFGSDIVCSWAPGSALPAMSPATRNKLVVTGPSAILQQPSGPLDRNPDTPGIVCENLHSVRLNIGGDFRTQFVDAFQQFCTSLKEEGQRVVLRPHPGGQYVLKNKVPIPENASINNAPMYRLDLRQFAYGISAPSSVLIDMLLANIPTAVWRDGGGTMDSSAYAGLVEISTPLDWMTFVQQARDNPEPILARQRDYLEQQQMPLSPEDVYDRFARIFQSACSLRPASPVVGKSHRILFIANALIPTLQLSFLKPLAPMIENGQVEIELLTEQMIRERERDAAGELAVQEWIETLIDEFDPTHILFCRYSGPCYESIIRHAKKHDIPLIYHIDDDLFKIPIELGEEKYRFHNSPERIGSVRYCIEKSDLLYCSTPNLASRMETYFPNANIRDGHVYCASSIIAEASASSSNVIGYMGFDHAHDLESVLPALTSFLRSNSHVKFELFGSIPKPRELDEFGSRIEVIPPVRDYSSFLQALAARRWDIGICPLVVSDFNLVKANTKWVEYTAVGAAVIASRNAVYEKCCSDGCGILAEATAEWISALETLTQDPVLRRDQILRAQTKLKTEYNLGSLRAQVLGIFDQAEMLTKGKPRTFQMEHS